MTCFSLQSDELRHMPLFCTVPCLFLVLSCQSALFQIPNEPIVTAELYADLVHIVKVAASSLVHTFHLFQGFTAKTGSCF